MSSRLIDSKILIPDGLKVSFSAPFIILSRVDGISSKVFIDPSIKFKFENNNFLIIKTDSDNFKAKSGTVISILNGAISDLSNGYKISLKLSGVGFKSSVQGSLLILFLGYSHDIAVSIPVGLKISVVDQVNIEISGYSRADASRFARFVANLRKRDPYKDKGVHFPGDFVFRKVGKKA